MRNHLLRWVGLASIAVLVLASLAACGGSDDAPEESESTSEQTATNPSGGAAVDVDFAPEIGSIDNWYNGSATTLAELRGSPVLLVFWADY